LRFQTRGQGRVEIDRVRANVRSVSKATMAILLAERGEQVRIVSRRGFGPEHPAIERVAADAADADRLSTLTAGAAMLYNCANPPYSLATDARPSVAAGALRALDRMSNHPTKSSAMSGTPCLRTGSL
jgi:uncharacterized protein YbjT (DUF2867 family)